MSLYEPSDSFFRSPLFRFAPAVLLERIISSRVRSFLRSCAFGVVILYALLYCASILQNKFIANGLESHLPLDPENHLIKGVFFLALAVWLAMKMLTYYFRSYYFLIEANLERGVVGTQTPYTTPNFALCDVYYDVQYGDLLKAFCQSTHGRNILRRLGVADGETNTFLKARTNILDWRKLLGQLRDVFTLSDLMRMLMTDTEFREWLFSKNIREEEVLGVAEWMERRAKRKRLMERYWGRAELGKVRSITADLSYGGAYFLSRFSYDLSNAATSGGAHFGAMYGSQEVKQLEQILSRTREANAMLIGEEGSGIMDVILDFARDIAHGHTNHLLKDKHVVLFDLQGFLATMKTKNELENALLRIMDDVVRAGNIILVIDNFPELLRSAEALEVNAVSLLDSYLASPHVQVIATANRGTYHQFIESNHALMNHFEHVTLMEPAEAALIRILEDEAETMERRTHIFFTYPALIEIARSADRYVVDGVMPDKAIHLLIELVPVLLSGGTQIVTPQSVLEFIGAKTQMPVGAIDGDEREKLLSLERLMKDLVVGQEDALTMIAEAMRRSRAGVHNPHRPIGAFLFLGPSGVGKTETAKALAHVFFGDEKKMSRIDMSEYQGENGLEKMIGSLAGGLGTLPVMLREHPYGVILLDEFEKTHPHVLDIFLQVFDEGIFHDAHGGKVNARNTIFIATSNAGAAEIRTAVRSQTPLAEVKKDIVDKIIAQGKFKPELFNRFDGVVLFHPLSMDDYRAIARMMLAKLESRLRAQGIHLVVNDVLINAVMAHGVDPDFGARPMARAVQDVVEQKVASKIIAGGVGTGQTLEFTAEDFK